MSVVFSKVYLEVRGKSVIMQTRKSKEIEKVCLGQGTNRTPKWADNLSIGYCVTWHRTGLLIGPELWLNAIVL